MSEHSKLSWRYKDLPDKDCQGQRHAVLGPPHPIDGGDYAPLFRTDKKSDALFVVKAANYHERLVDALRGLMWRFEDDDEDAHLQGDVAPDIAEVRAVLAALDAEGER